MIKPIDVKFFMQFVALNYYKYKRIKNHWQNTPPPIFIKAREQQSSFYEANMSSE